MALTQQSKLNNILIGCIGLLVIGLAGLWYFQSQSQKREPSMCTQEAKLCSDGSYVGRSGPNCEFTACPSESPVLNNWKTATDTESGVSFIYPDPLVVSPATNKQTTYIKLVEWPPRFKSEDVAFICNVRNFTEDLPTTIERRTIGEREYCVTEASEGAAGSVYTTYTYAFPLEYMLPGSDDRTGSLTFTLQFPQCGNYDDPEKTDCEHERLSFDIDGLVNTMIRSR